MVGRIATGEIEDNVTPAAKAHHVASAKKDKAIRAATLNG
jgi:hypothetical protein